MRLCRPFCRILEMIYYIRSYLEGACLLVGLLPCTLSREAIWRLR